MPATEKRTEILASRFSESESKALFHLADQMGVTVSHLIHVQMLVFLEISCGKTSGSHGIADVIERKR